MGRLINRFKDKYGGRRGLIDYSLLFIVLFLVGFGLVMLYSTSSYEAAMNYGKSWYFLERQLIFTILGLILMAIVSLIPYTLWKKFSAFLYILSIGLVLMVIPFGVEVNGAKRWIKFPVIPMRLQPAEVAKIGVIILCAMIIEWLGRKRISSFFGFVCTMAPALLAGVLIWKVTDNLSSAIIVVAIAFGMIFVASPEYLR